MGESEDLWFNGTHKELIKLVDQVSISCGAHAGSDRLIKETIESAILNKKSIGAHPSYPDRENFGRKSLNLSTEKVLISLHQQLLWLKNCTSSLGGVLEYIKPHGAFYHDCTTNAELREGLYSILKELKLNIPMPNIWLDWRVAWKNAVVCGIPLALYALWIEMGRQVSQ